MRNVIDSFSWFLSIIIIISLGVSIYEFDIEESAAYFFLLLITFPPIIKYLNRNLKSTTSRRFFFSIRFLIFFFILAAPSGNFKFISKDSEGNFITDFEDRDGERYFLKLKKYDQDRFYLMTVDAESKKEDSLVLLLSDHALKRFRFAFSETYLETRPGDLNNLERRKKELSGYEDRRFGKIKLMYKDKVKIITDGKKEIANLSLFSMYDEEKRTKYPVLVVYGSESKKNALIIMSRDQVQREDIMSFINNAMQYL